MKPADLARLFARALGELDLASAVADALPAPNAVTPARIIAVGKGAPEMARGVIARWRGAVERCLVVAPDGTATARLLRAAERAGVAHRVDIMRAAHPLPDARSVRAAEACLALVASEERRKILVLVSGGASSLVCAPSAGMTLRTKRAITRAMIASGAGVQDINLVRKHLSRIKGGRLAGAAVPNDVLTIVASDVIGGAASDVGSGPSVPELVAPKTGAARAILRRYAPAFAEVPLVRAPAFGVRPARVKVVVSPEELARVFATLLRARGVTVRLLPASQAPASELATEYAAHARRLLRAGPGVHAVVRAAEPSVVVPAIASRAGGGRGGRSTHLAALVGQALLGMGERRVLFGALASDGVDGASGCGGAIVDDRFALHVADRLGPMTLEGAIARFDTGSVHRAVGAAVGAGPTGHNLADLHVLVVC